MLLGCGSQDDALDQRLELLAPFALDDALVMVDQHAPQAFLLDTERDPLPTEPIVTALPNAPSIAVKRNGENEALVLCLGRRADRAHDEEPGALMAMGADGSTRQYTLGNPFDRIEQSEDGRYAFLYKSGSAPRLLDNPNEIAIIDLDKKPDDADAITHRTLRSFGDAPDRVLFSPPMTIASEERRLALVLSGSNVTLIDLNHLDRRETTVQLAAEGRAGVTPQQVLFNPDAPELYVRGDSSDDVFVFNLSPRVVDEAEARNDFRPFIDQLGVGGHPSDMALYGETGGARLLVLSNGSLASVVEASTSQVTSVMLPSPASQLLLFNAPSPRDDEPAPRALLYQPGQTTLMFLDLENLEERGSRNLETLVLQRPVTRLIPMLEENQVLVIHDEQTVSVVDLANRTAPPISSNESLSDALFDADHRRLWVGPPGQSYVAWFDLDTGDTREVLLDHDVQQLVPMFGAGRLAIVHPSALGLVTVLNVRGDVPSRDDARSVRGFFAAGILDRGE